MKLFEVEISQTIVVIAEDHAHAYDVAMENITELDWQEYSVDAAFEINRIQDLPTKWDGDCIPFGKPEVKIKDILEE